MRSRRCLRWMTVCAAMLAWASTADAVLLDRVAVRFEAPELGGAARPHFVMQRELAFEARLEALAEEARGFPKTHPYDSRHIRAALERHITEEILESLPVDPPVPADEIRKQSTECEVALEQRLGGRQNLLVAATAEGMEVGDLETLIERQARANLYLDRMVAPMLEPSDMELREVLRTESTPYRGSRYEDVQVRLRHWYVEERLVAAKAAFFQSARARIQVVRLAYDAARGVQP